MLNHGQRGGQGMPLLDLTSNADKLPAPTVTGDGVLGVERGAVAVHRADGAGQSCAGKQLGAVSAGVSALQGAAAWPTLARRGMAQCLLRTQ